MEEFLLKYINMPKIMEFHRKVAKTIWQRTQSNSAVQTFKNAKIVLTLIV